MIKEVAFYKTEVKENEAKLAEMKAQNQDPYDIKKFEEVLGESYMMVPDSTARLEDTLSDLAAYIESSDITEEHKSNEWYKMALELVANHQNTNQDQSDTVEETRVDDLAEGEAF